MRFRDFHPNIKIRLIFNFFTNLASTMVLPFLAIYFSKKMGDVTTGIFLLIIFLAGITGGLLSGFKTDKVGRKKFLVSSELWIFITYAGITVCNSPFLDAPYITVALFVINLYFSGIIGTVSQAMILDVSTDENRKYIFGFSYWASNLAVAIGGLLGAFLFKNYLFELFILISSISFLSFLASVFFISETYFPKPVNSTNIEPTVQNRNGIKDILSTYLVAFKDKAFMIFITASVLFLTLEQQLTNYIGIRLEKEIVPHKLSFFSYHIQLDGIRVLGFLKTENTLLVVLCTSLVIFLFKRLSDHTTLLAGIGLYTIGYTVLGASNSPLLLFIAMFVLTIGELMYIPNKQSLLGRLTPDTSRGSYMAISSLSSFSAMLFGAVGVTVGGLVPGWTMALLFFLIGTSSLLLMAKVAKFNPAREEEINVSQSV